MKRVAVLLMFLFSACLYSAEFQIVASGSLNGHLDGCYCTSSPKAGLVKLSAFLKKYKESQKNVLLLDSGDNLSAYVMKGANPRALLSSKYIFEGLKGIDFDAMVMGDQELSKGADFFLEYADDLPYLSANLKVGELGEKKEDFGDESTLKTVNGVKVGIIGVTGKSAFSSYMLDKTKHVKEYLEFSDVYNAIEDESESLRRRGADVVILLSHSGYNFDEELAGKLKRGSIDIIIGGHDNLLPLKMDDNYNYVRPFELIEKRYKSGGVYIFQPGKYGTYIPILTFDYSGGKLSLKSAKYRYINYGKKVKKGSYKPSDGEIANEDDKYIYLKGEEDDPAVRAWIKHLNKRR